MADENNYDAVPGEKLFSNQSYGYTKASSAAAAGRTVENPRMSVPIRVCLLVLSIVVVLVAISVVIVGAVSSVRNRDLRMEVDMLKTSINSKDTGMYIRT